MIVVHHTHPGSKRDMAINSMILISDEYLKQRAMTLNLNTGFYEPGTPQLGETPARARFAFPSGWGSTSSTPSPVQTTTKIISFCNDKLYSFCFE